MADEVMYSPELIAAIEAYKPPPKLAGVISSQSVAANVPVQRGTTIDVTVISPSDIPVSALVDVALLPAQLKDSSIDQLIQIQNNDPTLEAEAADPTTLSDPVKAAAFTQKVSAGLGKTFTAADTAGLVNALQKVRAR